MDSTPKFHLANPYLQTTTVLSSTRVFAPIAFALPFALLVLVVVLSVSYRILKGLNLAASNHNLVTTIHAFATEGAQLALAGLGVVNTAIFTCATLDVHTVCKITKPRSVALITLAAVGNVALHVVAVYAVDLIEGAILCPEMGWRHPYQGRCFIITRNWLFSRRRQKKGGLREQRRRRPASDQDLQAFEASIRETVSKLNYLDLALPSASPYHIQHRPQSFSPPTGSPTGSIAFISDFILHPNFQIISGNLLPTPPNTQSGRRGTKTVRWSNEITEVSPGGRERRKSLP